MLRHDPVVMRALRQRRESEIAGSTSGRRQRPKLRLMRLALAFVAGWLLRFGL